MNCLKFATSTSSRVSLGAHLAGESARAAGPWATANASADIKLRMLMVRGINVFITGSGPFIFGVFDITRPPDAHSCNIRRASRDTTISNPPR